MRQYSTILIGRRFQSLTVIEPAEVRNHKQCWLCRCDCGKTVVVPTGNLKSGNTKSCGCLSRKITIARNRSKGEDLTGRRFGRLHVLSIEKQDSGRWRCLCDCGKPTTVTTGSLTRGTKSCGCLQKEATTLTKTTHGQAAGERTKEYSIWSAMHARCRRYKNYADRGIKVCERWSGERGFENFFADMGKCPSDTHSIDRIDNNGNYEPGNCRWATATEQANNKRTNRLLTFNGRTATVMEWSRITGIGRTTIASRLRYGWPVDAALTTVIENR